MKLVFLFRRLVFIQVMLGIVAFCLAEPPHGNPGLLLIAGTLGLLSWYVAEGPTGRPLPQWTINIGATAAVLWLALDMYLQRGDVIIAMGHFTMWLQILQLYGRKSNREYGLILVLSLLQMVGASILSVSMLFGVMLAGYCALSLFTVLLFQFKATSDEIMEKNERASLRPMQSPRPAAVVGRGHRWHFRLTATLLGVFCAVVAVMIFVLIPRTSRYGTSPLGSAMGRAQIGFNSRVQLGGAPPTEGSREPVMHFQASYDLPYYLLRGAALDRYNPTTHTWTRGSRMQQNDKPILLDAGGADLRDQSDGEPMLDLTITLFGGRQRTLFHLFPTQHVDSPSLAVVVYNRYDHQLMMDSATPAVVEYHLRQPLWMQHGLSSPTPGPPAKDPPMAIGDRPYYAGSAPYAAGWNIEWKRIRQMALGVLDDAGIARNANESYKPQDYHRVATALARYLESTCSYSLSNPPPLGGQDPIVDFLFNRREGHCELFASALAALSRCVGLRARVVTGYRASEYNSIGGYYVVRQSNAHAWTEIDCGPLGWQTFDATPPAAVAEEHDPDGSWLSGLGDLYEHLEFLWIDAFVAYDKETRDEVLSSIGDSFDEAANDRDSFIGAIVGWFRDLTHNWRFNALSYTVMAVTLLFILIGVGSLVRMLVVRRRRLAALQLTRLPRAQRKTLARRLVFYLHMLDLLERHGFVRPQWQSPFRFATDLASADANCFGPVVALTEQFYEVRFGHRPLDEPRQQRVRASLKQLEQNMAGRRSQPARQAAR